ncbi:MAG: alpha-2-macroglobulin, partial [Flavobacteriaceae bacterium]|nr:alpha-2-macroglobulin [Flavobacteriaceae bacterium]
MKKLFFLPFYLFILLGVQSQDPTYEQLWREIAALEEKGLPKSALEKVEQISEMAEKSNDEDQIIKSLLYRSKYTLILEEDAQLKVIQDFKNTIAESSAPAKNVLQGYLANLYWQYFQQNRYRFYNRTNTSQKVDSTDFRTWDLITLFHEIDTHFKKSLQNKELLKTVPKGRFEAIIEEAQGSDSLRPSIYDLLAHNALDFYTTDENSISKPAYKFQLDDPIYLDIAENFKGLILQTNDSTSLQFRALQVYQELIKYHLDDQNIPALIDADIQRLLFVNKNSSLSQKDSLLVSTLNKSSEKYASFPGSALYKYEIARLYFEQGNKYEAKERPEFRWKLKEAKEICESVLEEFPNSIAAEKCEVLLNNIKRPHLSALSESYVPANTPNKILLVYKNLEDIKYTIYKATTAQIREFNQIYREDIKKNFIQKLTEYKSGEETLISEGDFQAHSIEVVIPELQNGHYILTLQADEKAVFATQTIEATNFGLVEKEAQDRQIFQVINRTNGEPITNAKVDFSYRGNNSNDF